MDSLELVVGQNVRLLDLKTTATLKIYSTRFKLLCFSNVVSAVVCQANGAQKLAVDRAHSSCVSRCSVCTLFTEHVYYIQKDTLEEASKSNQWEDWWECALEKMWHKRSLVAVKVLEVCECGCAQLSLTSWTVAVHFGGVMPLHVSCDWFKMHLLPNTRSSYWVLGKALLFTVRLVL